MDKKQNAESQKKIYLFFFFQYLHILSCKMTAHGVSKQHNKLYLKYINIIDILQFQSLPQKLLDIICTKVSMIL